MNNRPMTGTQVIQMLTTNDNIVVTIHQDAHKEFPKSRARVRHPVELRQLAHHRVIRSNAALNLLRRTAAIPPPAVQLTRQIAGPLAIRPHEKTRSATHADDVNASSKSVRFMIRSSTSRSRSGRRT